MPDAAPQPPAPAPPRKSSPPPGDPSPPGPETATPKPAEEGALFRALVDAGADAVVAYTADRRTQTMTSETVATQLQPFVVEMRQLFAAQERRFIERFDEQDRKLDALAGRVDALTSGVDALTSCVDALTSRVDALTSRVDALTSRGDVLTARVDALTTGLDVLTVRVDGLKVLGQIVLGALALLVTVLIAVFGFLFTT